MFDIDKLGLSTVNWKHGSDKFAEGTEEYYQNQLIRDYITLLIDPKSQHILHRSIDKDTKLLKDVLAEIESGTSVQEEPYGFYSLSTQTERKDDYITGKIGIGPFALNNNSHILTMLYGVKFREFDDSIMTELGLTDLSGHLDKDGNSIMSWLSALINAHVDIAKDPYISRLNVGPFTYNLVNTLIRTGLGAKTFYFTTQPIMKELSDAYNRAGSSYMADQYKSKYQLQKDAIEQVGKDRFGELKIDGWSFDELVQGISDPKDVKIKPVINNYIRQIFDEGILKTNANRTYNQIDGAELLPVRTTVDGEGEVEKVHFTPMLVQMLMYLAYLQFDPYATSVSNLVKYSKIDTKKHGKSYVEQQVYLKGFKKLFDNKDGGGLFEPEGLERLSKQSYIELKTINAISMTKNILKGQFLQATNAFDNAIQHVLNMIGKPDSLSVDLWNEVSRAITASIKSEFINEYAGALRPGNDTYIHDLVSESEETFEYTQSAKSNVIKLAGKPKYSLKSYMHKKAHVELMYKDPKTGERKPYSDDYTIIGYNDETNELIVDKQRKLHNNGKIIIKGGENTIYDRFNRLAVELREDPAYRDILDAAGEPRNMLLRSLVTGKTFDYKPQPFIPTYMKPEGADTYETLKFIKLFNALDQNGIESNFIIDAWDELLHDDNHPKLKEFAEDLVVYAFVTSGDQGGFTKFFKQVPFSWRKESGYADFINRKLVEFQSQDITTEQLQDAILNNWHNNMIVPKYNLLDENKQPNFMAYSGESLSTNYLAQRGYPTILAALKDNNGILEVSIDPDNAPLFIKIPRRTDQDARDSQRRVTVYKRVSYGMRKSTTGEWVHYPIYVKVEPKGNLLRGNFLMTEYGREDSLHKEYGPSEDGMKKMFALGDFIERSVVEEYKLKWGLIFGQMIEDMNYQYLYGERFAGNEEAFVRALEKQNKNSDYKGITKIISGGQTGVDTIGLEVGKELGLQTGGTITPGFYREQNVDQYTRQQLEEFGLQEISSELQDGKSGKEFYLPRTELNVINSDGTVYFASNEDSAGKIATERFARIHNKPFLLNPTADQLKNWLEKNNISVLNVAGNRGSKIGNMRDSVVNVLKQALNKDLNKEDVIKTQLLSDGEAPIQQVLKELPKHSSVWTKSISNYTRESVQNDPTTLYIFTDNTDRTSGGKEYGEGWYKDKYGKGGYGSDKNPTTAQIRGLENAAPISTMKYFYRLHKDMSVADARWKDSDIEEFKKVIDSEIEDIKKLWDSNKFLKIVSPAGDGFFNSKIAQISKLSDIGKYLQLKLQELYNYVNQEKPKQTPSITSDINVDSVRSVTISDKPQKLAFGRRTFGKYEANLIDGELVKGSIDGWNFDTEFLNRIDAIFLDVDFVKSLYLEESRREPGQEKASGMYTSNTENVDKAIDIVGEGMFDQDHDEGGEMVTKAADTLARFILLHPDEFEFVGQLAADFTSANDMLANYLDGKKPQSIFNVLYDIFTRLDESEISKDNYIEYSYRILPTEGELFSGVEYSEAEALMKEAEEIKKQCKG